MLKNFGALELIIILVIVLLVFGATRLRDLGREGVERVAGLDHDAGQGEDIAHPDVARRTPETERGEDAAVPRGLQRRGVEIAKRPGQELHRLSGDTGDVRLVRGDLRTL